MSKRDEYANKRFPNLNARELSNKYWTMDRVSADGNEIVVKVADTHIVPTRYGAALILDAEHVVFIKDWQFDQNYYGTEVRLNRQYWNVRKWGDFSDNFGFDETENYNFDYWKEAAEAQAAAENIVRWKKTPAEQKVGNFQKQAENKKRESEENAQ